ncbi:MAG: acetyl-CoA acetyltransferase [Myxococcota bacterium]
MDFSAVPDETPVLVGVGQCVDRVGAPAYQGWSAVEMAVEASRAAMADSGAADRIGAEIDWIATTRTFDDSARHLKLPFGRSNNFPRSICRRLGIRPATATWEDAGGNTPQSLLAEACERVASGEFRAALLTGAEAIATARHLVKTGGQADWSEELDEAVEDRQGQQIQGILSIHSYRHGLLAAPPLYGLCENARRGRAGADRAAWRAEMATWFAPFSACAAANPYAFAENPAYTPAEIAQVTAENRLIADPYPRLVVAQDRVNQGAAVLVTRVDVARRLGVAAEQCVFLHGYAAAKEKVVEHRADPSAYPAAVAATRLALERAGIGLDDLAAFDFYSCFPIAVSSVAEGLGLAADDPRGLTATGGLPYFGGPGNNYSMHAIASVVGRLRADPGSAGFVGANGGFLSKYAVGILSTRPAPFRAWDSAALQAEIDAVESPPFTETPSGRATIETYTLMYGRDGSPEQAVILGRLADDVRFLATAKEDESATLAQMAKEEPLGAAVVVETGEDGNRFRLA